MRKTPVVLGVLSMIFGGLVSSWCLVGLLTQSYVTDWSKTLSAAVAAQPHKAGAPDPAAMIASMTEVVQRLKPYTLAVSGGLLLFSLALAAIGFGLYRRQAWSRPAVLLWSVAALLFLPFQIYVQVGIVMPAMHEAMVQAFTNARMPTELVTTMLGAQKAITIFGQLAFYAPFPIVLLALMGRGSARNDLLSPSA
jgi:hypothetical protein